MKRYEKKLIGYKVQKVGGVRFAFKKLTPEDFLERDGIPISEWQMQYEVLRQKQLSKNITLAEIQKLHKKVFQKGLLEFSLVKRDDIGEKAFNNIIDKILANYELAGLLYNAMIEHSLGLKKKNFFKNIFQKSKQY